MSQSRNDAKKDSYQILLQRLKEYQLFRRSIKDLHKSHAHYPKYKKYKKNQEQLPIAEIKNSATSKTENEIHQVFSTVDSTPIVSTPSTPKHSVTLLKGNTFFTEKEVHESGKHFVPQDQVENFNSSLSVKQIAHIMWSCS